MKSLAVFDLGETLIFYKGVALDWKSHYKAALNNVCEKFTIPLNNCLVEKASSVLLKYNTRINPRIHEYNADLIFSEVLMSINGDDHLLSPFIIEFFKYFQRKSEPEETADELLSFLKEINFKIAVLTDVPYGMPKELVLNDLKLLNGFIDFIVTSVEAGYRKPSPHGLQLILNKFHSSASDAVFIGNEKKDIDTAKALGVDGVLLRSENSVIPNWGQSATIGRLNELKDLLE